VAIDELSIKLSETTTRASLIINMHNKQWTYTNFIEKKSKQSCIRLVFTLIEHMQL